MSPPNTTTDIPETVLPAVSEETLIIPPESITGADSQTAPKVDHAIAQRNSNEIVKEKEETYKIEEHPADIEASKDGPTATAPGALPKGHVNVPLSRSHFILVFVA